MELAMSDRAFSERHHRGSLMSRLQGEELVHDTAGATDQRGRRRSWSCGAFYCGSQAAGQRP